MAARVDGVSGSLQLNLLLVPHHFPLIGVAIFVTRARLHKAFVGYDDCK